MAGTTKGPRITDVLAEIARELWLSNRMRALTLGSSVLAHDTGSRAKDDTTRARIARKNALRAEVRAELGLEEES